MKYKKDVLQNGLRLITVPMADNPTVTVLVMVSTGSFYETKKNNGISHFLEHLCFKGTLTHPKPIDIVRELDEVGAVYNAFTSNEFTGYYAKGDAGHFNRLFDVVSDLYLNPTLPDEELQKEKGVIVQEIKMYNDLPQRKVFDVWTDLLYGDSPAGWSIAGEPETVESFSRKDFVTYRDKHYTAGRTTVVVAGNIDPKIVRTKVKALFGKLPTSAVTTYKPTREKQSAPQIKIEKKKTDQAHLIVGVRAFPHNDRRRRALQVLSGVLDAGMSSRLFQKMREELGICYYVHAGYDLFRTHGYFSLAAGVDSKRYPQAIEALCGELSILTKELVPADELERAKNSLIGKMYLSLESSDSIAEYFGETETMNEEIKLPKEIEKEIRAITAEDIRKVAKELFVNKHLNCAVVGDVKEVLVKKNLRIG